MPKPLKRTVAHLERMGRDQHEPSEDVADRLLGGETDDHGREGGAHRHCPKLHSSYPQADQDNREESEKANEKPDDAGRAGVQAIDELGLEGFAKAAREGPADQDQRTGRGQPDRLVGAEELIAKGMPVAIATSSGIRSISSRRARRPASMVWARSART
jgi:hypothetical protein